MSRLNAGCCRRGRRRAQFGPTSKRDILISIWSQVMRWVRAHNKYPWCARAMRCGRHSISHNVRALARAHSIVRWYAIVVATSRVGHQYTYARRTRTIWMGATGRRSRSIWRCARYASPSSLWLCRRTLAIISGFIVRTERRCYSLYIYICSAGGHPVRQ